MTAIADSLFDVSSATSLTRGDTAVTILRGLPTTVKFSIAACDAVGLTYWADHPGHARRGRYVWALDADSTAHIVHVCGGISGASTDHGTAQHVCQRAAWCYDRSGLKDSFRDTYLPECYGPPTLPAPVRFDVPRR